MYEIKSPHRLNCVAALPDKNCAVNINIAYIFLPKNIYRELEQVTCGHYGNCIWCTWVADFHMNICLIPFIPLLNSHIDNVEVRITSELNQPLLQFINAVVICMLDMLLHGRVHLIVNWIEIWAFQRR